MATIEVEKNTDELSKSNEAARAEATTPPVLDKSLLSKKKAVIQFKYRQYQTILLLPDESALPSNTGRRPNITVKARNYRAEFDLSDKRDKAIYDALMKSDRKGLDFWELTDAKKKVDTGDKGATLKRLMEMSEVQLSGMLSPEEMREAGLIPGTADKFAIMMAIITANKRLV